MIIYSKIITGSSIDSRNRKRHWVILLQYYSVYIQLRQNKYSTKKSSFFFKIS